MNSCRQIASILVEQRNHNTTILLCLINVNRAQNRVFGAVAAVYHSAQNRLDDISMAERFVLGFSGAIGSGRSELSRLVADKLKWPLLRFGDYLRALAGQDELAQE